MTTTSSATLNFVALKIEEEIAKTREMLDAMIRDGVAPARDHVDYGRWNELCGYLNAMQTCRRFFSM